MLKEKNMNIIRHGDINLHQVNKFEGKIIKHTGSYVVAEGETTGHKHILQVKNPTNLEIYQDTFGNTYFNLKEEGILTHEEHKELVVPKGIYKEIREREVDHFAEVTRTVID